MMMVAGCVWSFFGFLASLVTHIPDQIWLVKLLYLGSNSVPVFFMLYVLEYTHKLPRLKLLHYTLLFAIPALSDIAGFTNQVHHLMWTDISLFETSFSKTTASYAPGPLFFLMIAYNYMLIVYGLLVLLKSTRKTPHQYSTQSLIVFLSVFIPFLTNILFCIFEKGYKSMDMTPLTFSIGGFLFMIGMKKHGLLQISPITRDHLFDSMKDAVLFMDTNNQIIDYNKSASVILKMRFRKNPVKNYLNIQKQHPLLYDICVSAVEEVNDIMLYDDPPMYYHIRTHKIYDTWGNTIGKVILLHDVTDHVKAKQIIRDKNKELARLNRQKDKILSILSHDLRSPFASIIGIAELLMNNYYTFSEEDKRTFIVHFINRSKITLDMLENLLQWSKYQVNNNTNYDSVDLNIEQQVDGIMGIYASLAHDKNIFIEVEKDPHPQPKICINSQTFNIVLRNLLTNAIKFTPNGGRITIRYKYDQKSCTICVADTGVGIPPEDMKQLFDSEDAFYTMGTNGELGSGLGLNLCKEFVEKMGGRLSIDSIPDQGTTVTFFVPYSSSVLVKEKSKISW
jgi:signal transduction histidine kinase